MDSDVRSILADMVESRRRVFAELAELPETRLTEPARWGGREFDVRFILLRFADHEEEHALQVRKTLDGFGWRQTEAQQILGSAQTTRGDVRGAVVGLGDADMDLAPPGEWPLRLILWHIAQTERNYTRAITWAATLFRAGREWEQHERPALLPEDGDFTMFLGHIEKERAHLLDQLIGVEDDVMAAPTIWAEVRTNVRFRLMRVAHHEREHTAHILKWREQVGRRHTDAQRLLGYVWSARGALESQLVGLPDELLDRAPANGDGTIRSVLAHVRQTDELLKERALGNT